ncbi:MbeD family mobilization/exclusion protein [Salmonella enterica]|uniref:MbeD family mobilization/exclusion protein n=1 Tax=Salmonella enterica TaxID=28901 RepID=UPI0035CED2B1
MTELEKHLLNALESLEKQYNEQLAVFETTQSNLQKMFAHTSLENQRLQSQVTNLTEQVSNLTSQVRDLARLYSTNKR